jgi:opacity protein-like surface antigen
MTIVSSRRIACLGGFAAALATSLYAVDADAAPRGRRGDGIHQGGYIYGAPGVVQLPIEDDDYFDLDPTWGWGIGGGYLWTPTRYFKIAAGGSFEHTIYNWDDFDEDDDILGNQLRLAGELRIGGGTNKVWGYGLVGPGLALSIIDVDSPVFDDDTDAGFNLTVGGGVQGAVWRSLFLGGELDFDLTWFPDDDDLPGNLDDDYEIHQLWIKFVIGWYF